MFANLGALAVFAALIFVGYYAGRAAENRHFHSIHAREQETKNVLLTTNETIPGMERVGRAQLAIGTVVVSLDYFKRVIAGLRMLFGGEVRAYTPLMERGRREAILRLKESCPSANAFVNVRVETSAVANVSGNNKATGGIEVIAYGTALYFHK